MKVKFYDLPKGFIRQFIAKSNVLLLRSTLYFDSKMGSDIVKELTNIDIDIIYHCGDSYDNDELEFNSEYEYILFLMSI